MLSWWLLLEGYHRELVCYRTLGSPGVLGSPFAASSSLIVEVDQLLMLDYFGFFCRFVELWANMSYSLNSLKGIIWGIIYGTTIGLIRGDTMSLDYSSHV